jgi:AcrR family transcriptional regulator
MTAMPMVAAAPTIAPPPNEGKHPAAPPRRGRPPLDPAVRRQRIITVASDLFTKRGFVETTVEAVGKAAGVTKRTIYELIGDKEALFRAVCDHCHANIGDVHLDLSVGGSIRETLLQLAETLIEHSLSEETIAVERAVIAEQMRFPDLIRILMGSPRSALNRKIAAFFEELIAAGMISPLDTFKTTEIFFDVVVGNLGFRKALGYDEPLPTAADIAERVDVFITGHLRRHGLADAQD